MSAPTVAVVVQGLFEKSDSIGYDAVYQYNEIRSLVGADKISLFAERFDAKLYPETRIHPITDLEAWTARNPSGIMIYHFCDGWPEFEDTLASFPGRRIIRWHNNTPPWFYADRGSRLVKRTVNGFRTIIRLIKQAKCEAWVNSKFSAQQLSVLGCPADAKVVFPGSRALYRNPIAPTKPSEKKAINLLFVSRIVAHKGHKHILRVSELLSSKLDREVRVSFPGRRDSSAIEFNESLDSLAAALSHRITIDFPGEVPESELVALYDSCDALVCLSEHEGFGMPVFEAMLRGKPVIAWGNSATAEMLDGHPLMHRRFDLALFAASIEAAIDPAAWPRVMQAQTEILKRYSRDVVAKQIEDALVHPGVSRCADSMHANALIKDRATKYSCEQVTEDFDFDGNLVSLYDLTAFETLMEGTGKLEQFSAGNAEPEHRAVIFKANEFFYHHAKPTHNQCLIEASGLYRQHLVFGPYSDVPPGRYRLKFLFDFARDCSDFTGKIEVAGRGGIIAARPIAVPASEDRWETEFQASERQHECEFRIWIEHASVMKASFYGCLVEKLPTLDDLLDAHVDLNAALDTLLKKDDLPPPSRPWRRSFLSPWRKAAADRAFARADEQRDRKNWIDASDCYQQALALDDTRVEYWIQLGNVSKEAGRFSVAEDAFKKAVALDPHNAEAFLQFGHFLKVSGNILMAERMYLSAAATQKPSVKALLELLSLGATPNEIRKSLT